MSGTLSRRVVLGGLVAAAALPVAAPSRAAPIGPTRTQPAAVTRRIGERFYRGRALSAGVLRGVVAADDGVRITTPSATRTYADPHLGGPAVSYDFATWDSQVITPPFAWTELIASWTAQTPPGTWLELAIRGVDAAGTATGWLILGRWAAQDVSDGGAIQRTSVPDQTTSAATVDVDTLQVRNTAAFRSWQLRVVLNRRAGSAATPVLRLAGAVATAVPAAGSPTEPTSAFGGTVTTLNVPAYSQEVHIGHYTAWGGGGEAWCSATTTAMLLDYWGAGPSTAEKSWVSPPVDAQVDVVARGVYDPAYGGTGNWPFNTAYAGTRRRSDGTLLKGYVTRLPDLAAAEPYLRAGIPLGVSLSFSADQLTGAGYGTNGHLMVLAGFDASGNPVVNDPAAHLIADNARVRTTYQRAQFERAWANSGRTTYVVRPAPSTAPPPADALTRTPSGRAVPFTSGGRTMARRR